MKILSGILIIGFASIFPATAKIDDRFVCKVNRMVTSGDDDEFIKSNMGKVFYIFERADEFTVVTHSTKSKSSQQSYSIIKKDIWANYGVSVTGYGLETLSISKGGSGPENSFEATLTVLDSSFANIWMLDCKPE